MLKELGIYIHIPFCVKKCAYCDFLSGPAGKGEMEHYTEMLCRELKSRPEGKKSHQVTSIFFGGGTPSVLPVDCTRRILDTIREEYDLAGDAEITTEVNPGTVGRGVGQDGTHCEDKLLSYRQMGFNRLSFGLQSADDQELKALGRIHTWEDFLENYSHAREVGFANINVDVMAALPGQTWESFQVTLNKVLGLRPEHLSVYSLIIEEGTPFYETYASDAGKRDDGEEPEFLPSEEEERRIYEGTADMLSEQGYIHYEISNYARDSFACRHNDNCWKRVEYLGFGIGAASLFEEERFSCHRSLKRYLEGDFSSEERQKLSVQEQMEEMMFLGLRRIEGVSRSAFEQQFQVCMEDIYGEELKHFQAEGLLEIKGDFVCLTREGLNVANYVMAGFLKD